MKALTLYQPWASLIAMGVKSIETRSWKTNYTGRLAIHAAKQVWPQAGIDLLNDGRVAAAYREITGNELQKIWHVWPHGAIVATCKLVFCREILEWPDLYVYDYRMKAAVKIGESLEGLLGDFRPGRFAWMLEDVQPLRVPIAATGHQGLWNWNEG